MMTFIRRKVILDNKFGQALRAEVANAITDSLGSPVMNHLPRTTSRVSKRDIYRLKARITSLMPRSQDSRESLTHGVYGS